MKFVAAFKEWFMVKSSGQPGPYYEISGRRENVITIDTNGERNIVWRGNGKNIIKNQIKPNLDLSAKNIIVIPHDVQLVSMLFIENIFKLVPKYIRKNYSFYELFYIDANERVTAKFLSSVLCGWSL